MKASSLPRPHSSILWATFGPSTTLTGLALASHLQYGSTPAAVEFGLSLAALCLSATSTFNGWDSDLSIVSGALALILLQVGVTSQFGFAAPTFYAWVVNSLVAAVVASVTRHRRLNNHDHHLRRIEVETARTKLELMRHRAAVTTGRRSGFIPSDEDQSVYAPAAGAVTLGREETAIRDAVFALYKVELPAVSVSPLNSAAPDEGWEASIDLPPQLHRDKLTKDLPRFIGALALPGSLEALPGPLSSQVVLRYLVGDPLASPVPYEAVSGASFLDPVLLGRDAFGQPVTVDIAYSHIMVAGSSKFGKSTLMKLLALRLADMADVVLLGVDMKPGAPEFTLMRPILHDLATTVSQATVMFEWLVTEMHERGTILAKAGDTLWDPSKHGRPAIFVLIDEMAELVRQGSKVAKGEKPVTERIESLLALARGYGIHLLMGTQQPSNRVFGGATDARGNIPIRLSVRTNDARHAVFMFAGSPQFKPGDLDLPGKAVIMSPAHTDGRPFKAQWVPDDTAASEVARLSMSMVPAPINHRLILPAPIEFSFQDRIRYTLEAYGECSRAELDRACLTSKEQTLRALRAMAPEASQDLTTTFWSLRPDDWLAKTTP